MIKRLPANCALAVRRSFRDTQGLPNLGLRQSQGQPPQLERLGELLDLVQINAIDHVTSRLVYGGLACN